MVIEGNIGCQVLGGGGGGGGGVALPPNLNIAAPLAPIPLIGVLLPKFLLGQFSVHCKISSVTSTPNLLHRHAKNGNRCEYRANLVCWSHCCFYSVVK